MELVVADSNIFVYFFRADLLEKILTHQKLVLRITGIVFKELTAGMRISREYPELSQIIKDAINNPKTAYNLSKVDVNIEICAGYGNLL